MRRSLNVIAGLVALAAATPALADCSKEVADAIVSQGKQKFIRKDTNMVSENGPVLMTLEFQLPDRMRQVVSMVVDPKPVETIVVGDRAWTTEGGEGWYELPPQAAEQVVDFMKKSTGQGPEAVGLFECVGTETVDGKELRAYRGIDEPPADPKATRTKNEGVRIVYLDPATNLPARSIFARKDFMDKPIYKEVYSYPDSLNIEPPKDVKN